MLFAFYVLSVCWQFDEIYYNYWHWKERFLESLGLAQYFHRCWRFVTFVAWRGFSFFPAWILFHMIRTLVSILCSFLSNYEGYSLLPWTTHVL